MRAFAELLLTKGARRLREATLADSRISREEITSSTPLAAYQQRDIITAFASEFARRCRLRDYDAILFAENFIVAVALFVEGMLTPHHRARLANRLRELADVVDPRRRQQAGREPRCARDTAAALGPDPH